MSGFEVTAASVPGRDHLGRNGVLYGRNNQDAAFYVTRPGLLAGVLCDGCSEGRHSEVGAKLAARWLAYGLAERALEKQDEGWTLFFESVRQRMLTFLTGLISLQAGGVSEAVKDYLLFTVVGLLLTDKETIFFSMGDGLFIHNEKITDLGEFKQNRPPYLSYAISPKLKQSFPEVNSFRLEVYPADAGEICLIATDGAKELINTEAKRFPGREDTIPSLLELAFDEKLFVNPDYLRRKLSLINREAVSLKDGGICFETGPLGDDTTLLIARRPERLNDENPGDCD